MGRHNMERLQTPEEFAREILGTQNEQTLQYLERQIRWRQDLMNRYQGEIAVMRKQYDAIVATERALAEEAAAQRAADPESTQEFTPPIPQKVDDEEPDEEEGSDAKPGAPNPSRPKRTTRPRPAAKSGG